MPLRIRNLKRLSLPLICLLLAGCSTVPCADCLDCFCRGRFRAKATDRPFGGVCLPTGLPGSRGQPPPIVTPVPTAPGVPVPVPSAPVVPPPMPFPSTPGGNVPPPPPPPPL